MNHHPLSLRQTTRLERLLRWAMLALAVSLAACGGSGGDDDAAGVVQFEVIAGGDACGAAGCGADSADGGGAGGGGGGDGGGDGAGGGLGAMRNVRVTARKPNGDMLGSALLTNNLVSLYDRVYKGEFILEFADDGSGTGAYFDEAVKDWVPLNGQALHILVPSLTHHVSANPLTEAAYQWALYKYGTESALTAVRMAEANETVRVAFNARVSTPYQVSDITNYAVAVSDTTVANSLPNTHAGRFGTLLAAIPRAGRSFFGALPSPALSFMRQLVKDVRDDSVVNASGDDAESEAYDSTLSLLLAEAILDARADYGVPAQPAPTPVANACFNPALFALGTKWSLSYIDTPPNSTQSALAVLDLEVTSQTASFQQYSSALEVKQFDGETTSYLYFSSDISAGLIRYGSKQDVVVSQVPLSFQNLIDPTAVNRQFLLKPGESDTVTETITSTYFNPDGTVFAQQGTITETTTTTFVGYETVTVPAGRFKNACKYTIADSGGTTTVWVTASGQGVSVRTLGSDGTVSELQSGTVNNQTVK